MGSPQVAVPLFSQPSPVSTFEKFSSASRQDQIDKEQNSAPAAGTGAGPDVDLDWTPSFPSVKPNSFELSLPVIDLGALRSEDPAARAKLVNEIGSATESWGFFQVVNHGIADELVDKMQEQSRQFFNLPLFMKKRAEILVDNNRSLGYKAAFAPGHEEIPIKEALSGFRLPPISAGDLAATIWTGGKSEFSDTLEEHGRSVEALGLEILELLAERLGVRRTFFSEHFQAGRGNSNTWRLHHFPSGAAPSTELRTVPHCDPSVVTLLQQDLGGLQVKVPKFGTWIDVKLVPGSFVVNVGDILEAWSNGKFPSVEHRVSLREGFERFSTVNFLEPTSSTLIEAPSETIDDEHPSLFKPFVASEFREHFDRNRLRRTMGKGKVLDSVRRNLA